MWQIAVTKASILAVNKKIQSAKEARNKLEFTGYLSEKNKIELRYAQNDIDRGYTEKQQLVRKMDAFLKEYYCDDFVPYQDEVDIAEKERELVWKMDEHPFRVHLVWVEK